MRFVNDPSISLVMRRTPASWKTWFVAATESPHADRPAGILHYVGFEARLHAVDGRVTHAVVISQAREKDAPQSALAQIAGKPGTRDAIVLPESRIGVDVIAKALAQNQLRIVGLQMRMESRPHASLHAMIGPQHLLAVSRLNGVKRNSSRDDSRRRNDDPAGASPGS